jgi:purine-binding chemotaxis protein CheW
MSEPKPTMGDTPTWDALARNAANVRTQGESTDELCQLLAFELDGAPYAVPVERVREIVRMRPVTPVPRFPVDVRGVISLRGEIIQVIDLRRRLGVEPAEPTRRTRIIVATTSTGDAAGMLVDSVRSVMRVPIESIRPASGSESGAIESLFACEDQFVSVVELDQVLSIDA